jgi:hypothetical protein
MIQHKQNTKTRAMKKRIKDSGLLMGEDLDRLQHLQNCVKM